MFQVNPLPRIKPFFLQKIKVKKLKCRLLQFLYGTLNVNSILASWEVVEIVLECLITELEC